MPKKTHHSKTKKTEEVEELKPLITEDIEEENPKKELDPDLVDSLFEEPVELDEDEDDGFGTDDEEEESTW